MDVAACRDLPEGIWFSIRAELEPDFFSDLIHHPFERNVRHGVIGITATHIGVYTREPHLGNSFPGDCSITAFVGFARVFRSFANEQRMEGFSFVVER